MQLVRDTVQGRVSNIGFVRSNHNLADGLAKPKMQLALLNTMSTGLHNVFVEKWIIRDPDACVELRSCTGVIADFPSLPLSIQSFFPKTVHLILNTAIPTMYNFRHTCHSRKTHGTVYVYFFFYLNCTNFRTNAKLLICHLF